MRLYLAGAMFTVAERLWQRFIASAFRQRGYEVYLPQEHQACQFDARAIKQSNINGILTSDIIIVWLEGPDPDSGTCWEQGYSEGLGKRVVSYTTDLRYRGAKNWRYDLNLMVTQGPDCVRFSSDATPDHVVEVLVKWI